MDYNIFQEEYEKVSGERKFIVLSDVLKISMLDDDNEFKINFAHIRTSGFYLLILIATLFFLDDDKDGKFTKENFECLSVIYQQKEKVYKRYEFRSQLQAHFTLLMWKQVCSLEGEKIFIDWVKILLIEAQMVLNTDESEEDINPDPSKYIGRHTIRLLYDILNVKLTHGIDFQYFFDLMQVVSENMGLTEEHNEVFEDFVHVNVLEFFCKNFIRGFSKLIIDLGFDSFMLDEIE